MDQNDEDNTHRVDGIAEDVTTDASGSDVSSLDSSLYNNLAWNVYTSSETVDFSSKQSYSSLEYFNSILRPAERSERIGQVLPMSITTPSQQASLPDALTPVLSLESPFLGHVDINKGCFDLIRLHCERNQQLERELEKLRRERRELDTELLCRGDDIAHYKKEIETLKENQHR
ncbi:hypothetical protein PG993_011732 [Apiospora rasikravindrae]|uniref:Uncharacterized protein n=1 Tax=Apiospora rasikravindrae TaxID=990691 RepID=A0ABR1S0G0_9PEZI